MCSVQKGHEATNAALLIGLPASKLGSADPILSKTLCLHLPSLLPIRNLDIEISPLIQTSALSGLGLLYCGSANRLMVEFLLSELNRKLSSDWVDYKEATTLAAGWALGMVLLGRGRGDETGLIELRVEDRLMHLIVGGPRSRFGSSIFSVRCTTLLINKTH